MSAAQKTPLSVVAVVSMNGNSEALVLNRPLHFIYERSGMDYIGSDGPFLDILAYARDGGRFVAFAGRSFTLPLADGSSVTVKDHWWQGSRRGTVGVIHSDVESLKKCYVFSGGACIAPEALAELRATYTGCVYPYWDYEKVIKYDDLRKDLYGRLFAEERRCRALVAAVKSKHRELRALRASS